ncbi:GNAT family protein [Uliginosibacterium sp. H3]|uniref:GNAT family protein n=1 Tax=Uliginosibacterium silvisoli TaxID=3114758 RepID=A0ABU6K3S7_9RHOO|nr:GNAT family protein [Uliginosibacterium sp. H3]
MDIRLPGKIETERLVLRSPLLADADVIFDAYAQDAEVCRYMVWTPHTDAGATQLFIASCIEAWQANLRFAYIITERGLNTPLGMLEARLLNTTIDIGYVLARAHWGKSMMPEAIEALSSIVLANPKLFRIQATCDVENIPSQRTLEKAGFLREKRLERHTIHPNISPEPRACLMYAKTR